MRGCLSVGGSSARRRRRNHRRGRGATRAATISGFSAAKTCARGREGRREREAEREGRREREGERGREEIHRLMAAIGSFSRMRNSFLPSSDSPWEKSEIASRRAAHAHSVDEGDKRRIPFPRPSSARRAGRQGGSPKLTILAKNEEGVIIAVCFNFKTHARFTYAN